MSIPTLYVSKKSTVDPLLDLLSRKTQGVGKERRHNETKETKKTNVLQDMPILNFLSSDVKQGDGLETSRRERERVIPGWSSDRVADDDGASFSGERLFGMTIKGKRGLLKGRRCREEGKGDPHTATTRNREQASPRHVAEPTVEALNLASLAAQAGANAATGDVLGEEREVREKTSQTKRRGTRAKDAMPKESKRVGKRPYKRRSELSPLMLNGAAIPRVVGVPDDVLIELASLPPTERPVRCGVCRSCENPARKKACEVIRSLGANPPIPRGKNRLAILGPENTRKHVSRVCDVPFSNTPLSQGDDGKKKFTPSSGDANNLRERMEDATWTEEQTQALYQALLEISPNTNNFWQKVSCHVPGRTEAECFAKMYENAPLYSTSNKPKRSGAKASDQSTPLDPNDEEYLSHLMKRRRDRAMGNLGRRMRARVVEETSSKAVSGGELVEDIRKALEAADDGQTDDDSDWSDAA